MRSFALISISALVLILSGDFAQARSGAPRVELDTSMGKIVLELNAKKAPGTVKNFLQYVKDKHYDGTIFHRIIDNFMVQGGGFTADYKKKAGRDPIKNEADNGLKNLKGTIAMARTPNPHSGSNQFFINVNDNTFLNHKEKSMRGWGYCVFGKVVKGLDIVMKMGKVRTGRGGPFPKDVPQETVLIKKARLLK